MSLVVTALVALGGTVTATPAHAVVVGVCTIKANNPHGSSHVSGTVNAVGTVSCTLVMSEIYVFTTLEKSTGASWAGNNEDWFNSAAESSNAATSCSQAPGVFRARVAYAIHAPAGVNPRSTANTLYSPWISVTCSTAQIVVPGAASAGLVPATIVTPLDFGSETVAFDG